MRSLTGAVVERASAERASRSRVDGAVTMRGFFDLGEQSVRQRVGWNKARCSHPEARVSP